MVLRGNSFPSIFLQPGKKHRQGIEMEMPDRFNPFKIDIYMRSTDLVTELETKINAYYMGVSRKDISMVVNPKFYSRLLRALAGDRMLFDKTLDFIQNESITPSKIAGIPIVRHIGLNNEIVRQATNEFRTYDFRGIRAIIYHVATP